MKDDQQTPIAPSDDTAAQPSPIAPTLKPLQPSSQPSFPAMKVEMAEKNEIKTPSQLDADFTTTPAPTPPLSQLSQAEKPQPIDEPTITSDEKTLKKGKALRIGVIVAVLIGGIISAIAIYLNETIYKTGTLSCEKNEVGIYTSFDFSYEKGKLVYSKQKVEITTDEFISEKELKSFVKSQTKDLSYDIKYRAYKKDAHTSVIEGEMPPEYARDELKSYKDAKKYIESKMDLVCN